MTVISLPQPGDSRADRLWNFTICLIDAIGWPLGVAFFSITTIMPVFLHDLGASNTLIGCLPALYNLLIFLPGILFVRTVQQLPRVRGYLFTIAVIERLFILPLAWLTLVWGRTHPQWLLVSVFVIFAFHAFAMGVNQPAYWAVVGKSVPAQWRGRLFGYAGGIAGILGFGVEWLLRHLLSGPTGGFPEGFSACFLIGCAVMMVSVLPFAVIREPYEAPQVNIDPHSGNYRRDSLRVWRSHPDFRRFLYGQMVGNLSAIALPFFVLFAQRHFHAGTAAVAGYTAILVLGQAFGGLGWGALGDRKGNKQVLLAAAGCAVFAAVTALLAANAIAFYGVFLALALSIAGVNIAGNNIVLEYAGQPRDIPLYTALFNTAIAVPRAVAPLLGGLLADRFGNYRLLFILSAILALASLLLTLRAGDPRLQTKGNTYG